LPSSSALLDVAGELAEICGRFYKARVRNLAFQASDIFRRANRAFVSHRGYTKTGGQETIKPARASTSTLKLGK
jgi:hypothetical protein